MTEAPLPANVYRLPQAEFDAVPGSPWAYWVDDHIRHLFSIFPSLGAIGSPKQGLITADVFRFVRFWWETGLSNIALDTFSRNEATNIDKTWFPYMKSGRYAKWFGVQDHVVNWRNNGYEIQNYYSANGRLASRPQNMNFYFKEGITYSYLSSANFSARYSPGGFIFDVAGSSLFPDDIQLVLAILNSKLATFLLRLINPTVNFPVGSLANLPIPNLSNLKIKNLVSKCIKLRKFEDTTWEELSYFCLPKNWVNSPSSNNKIHILDNIEKEIEQEIFKIYSIPENIQHTFENYLLEQSTVLESIDDPEIDEDQSEKDENEISQIMSTEELAVRWISYALGVTVRRFQPGKSSALGSTIYRREDFAIGSLPAPDEADFNQLVGEPDTFAFIDSTGGRHVFSAKVEHALNALAFEDGITVLDEGHPRDLAARVEQALVLMLGENSAQEVIQAACGASTSPSASLRKFLEKDYFTTWHFKWYRKRPVYWPIQSVRRSYGFVVFHEKITRDALYTLQRDPYLDTKRNAVALKIGDLQGVLATAQGATRKRLEKELDELNKLSEELAEFAKELVAITMSGYNHAPDWIDDGVILRLAPLWKVLPVWKAEPKKYWERLTAGDFDWSHIAMNYRPEQVKAKCKTNKSYAIAHGHEEWYEGK